MPTDPALPRAPQTSVDLSDEVELDPEPPSFNVESDGEVEISVVMFDTELHAEPLSTSNLMAVTGEHALPLADYKDELHALAARGKRRTTVHNKVPSLAIPTPFDLGAISQPPRSMPPPLPAAGIVLPPLAPLPPLGANLLSAPPGLGPHLAGGGNATAGAAGLALPSRPPPARGASSANIASIAPPAAVAAPAAKRGSPLLEVLELASTQLAALTPKDGQIPGDLVALTRARLEVAVLAELVGDETRAAAELARALKDDGRVAFAHAMARRRIHGQAQLGNMLEHVEAEISLATAEAAVVELVAERARLLRAAGASGTEVRAAWARALGREPQDPAALRGLDAELAHETDDPELQRAYADHLGTLATAYASQRELSGWLERERARVLEFQVGAVGEARAALERALEQDASVGPVRQAYVQFLANHEDYATLVAMLDEEAQIESDPNRSADLELDAARIAHLKLRDDSRAIGLLERAAARAPTARDRDKQVLAELIVLYEMRGLHVEVARARRLRMHYLAPSADELLRLAAVEERLGNVHQAIVDLAHARELQQGDAAIVEWLDRLLAAVNRTQDRQDLWLSEARRASAPGSQVRALCKAADLARASGATEEAKRHLSAAFEKDPSDAEVVDALGPLLSPTRHESVIGPSRHVVELYERAALNATDSERQLAYLERAAVIWEEVLGDPARARTLYEQMLRVNAERRSAILGLGRTARRLRDPAAEATALLAEARLAAEPAAARDLQVRAGWLLAAHDPERAERLTSAVLNTDPAHARARTLEVRLHEQAGRFEAAGQSMRAQLATCAKPQRVGLMLALAALEDTRLGDSLAAVRVLEQARSEDPLAIEPPLAIARLLTKHGNDLALRLALENLANTASAREDRAAHLVGAGEVCEFRLSDDAAAAKLYVQALLETPQDPLVSMRLSRVLARRAHRAGARAVPEQLTLLSKRLEREAEPRAHRELAFELAELLLATGQDVPRAITLLASILDDAPAHVGALRTLEIVARQTHNHSLLARTLSAQGTRFTDARARIGALRMQAFVEEWQNGTETSAFERILAIDAHDAGSIFATIRLKLSAARKGDALAQRALVDALRASCSLLTDDSSRLLAELSLAFALETFAQDRPTWLHEALEHYYAALSIDRSSISAATSLARLANRLANAEGAVLAAECLADLAKSRPKVRARYLLDAASLLLSDAADARLGEEGDRRARAGVLLEEALLADPDSVAAAAALATLYQQDGAHVRIVDVLRSALARATLSEAVIMLGAEIAAVAREELRDLPLAVEAMRRVRADAPDHLPSLMTLAELYIETRAWDPAVEALEAIAARSRAGSERMTALFALSRIYEDVQQRPDEAERVLRQCVLAEPQNPRALRALLRRLANKAGGAQAAHDHRAEIAELVLRVAELEPDRAQKAQLLLELADLRQELAEHHLAEKALIEAVAYAPQSRSAFEKLSGFFAQDAAGHARALTQIIAKGREIGTKNPHWFHALGLVEIERLGRPRDGIPHLVQAIRMDPNLHEARFEVAAARARIGANADASKTLLEMIAPDPSSLLGLKSPQGALDLLERTLSAERHGEEAIVVSELRAVAGDLDEGRYAWLRARRVGPLEAHHTPFDRAELTSFAVPEKGQHALLEVAAASMGLEAKTLRADLTDLGITAKDRVGSRSGHPLRAMLDRLAKAVGVTDLELVVSATSSRTRVLIQDEPWIVVPKKIEALPEPTQLATLARAVAKVALGVPWLEELSPPHIEAYLVACARQVAPGYGEQELDVLARRLVVQYEAAVSKSVSRKQRAALEKLLARLGTAEARLGSIDTFVAALQHAELRIAYLITGDLLATVDELRGVDGEFLRATASPGTQALGALLQHPFAGALCRFALQPETSLLRKRVATTWTR